MPRLTIPLVVFMFCFGATAFAQTPTEIRAAQEQLTNRGFSPGPIDGLWGKKTSEALRRFQEVEGLKVTGRLDQTTKQRLGIKEQTKGQGKLHCSCSLTHLALPKESGGGWKLDAGASESGLRLGWKDKSGKKYSVPISFVNFPNGAFGAVGTLDGDKKLWPFPKKSIPIEAIEKALRETGSFEVQPEPPQAYDGTYTLLNPSGDTTQELEVASINEAGDELAFVAGNMYLIFPKGDPAGGIESLVTAPGTRVLLHPGVVVRGKKLTGSALSVDILLKNIDGREFLNYRVTVVGPDAPRIAESN